MQKDFTWQLISNNLLSSSCGLLLSTTDNSFIIKNLQDNTILQTLPFEDFFSEYCKYPSEILASIKRILSCSSDYDYKTVFYDSLASEKISDLCKSNCLLF